MNIKVLPNGAITPTTDVGPVNGTRQQWKSKTNKKGRMWGGNKKAKGH